MSPIKITLVVENFSLREELKSEHGLSLWIEAGGKKILFDCGQKEAFKHNIDQLGIKLAESDAIVISHGHYDHTGNLTLVLEKTDCPIHLHPDALLTRYSIHTDKPVRSIGISTTQQKVLEEAKERIVYNQDFRKISEGIWLSGEVKRKKEFNNQGDIFFLDPEGVEPDSISDDQSIVIDSDKGLIIILGCAHSGLINIVNHIKDKLPGKKIRAVIGGTHLLNDGIEKIKRIASKLEAENLELFAPIHCSGELTKLYFADKYPEITSLATTGTCFNFD